MWEAKVARMMRPALREAARERLTDERLGAVVPRPADIGGVRAEHEHAALAQRGEARVVRLL